MAIPYTCFSNNEYRIYCRDMSRVRMMTNEEGVVVGLHVLPVNSEVSPKQPETSGVASKPVEIQKKKFSLAKTMREKLKTGGDKAYVPMKYRNNVYQVAKNLGFKISATYRNRKDVLVIRVS